MSFCLTKTSRKKFHAISKRSELLSLEEEWLDTDFASADPDDFDFTIDEGENTLFNYQYRVKIDSSIYEMKEDGLFNIATNTYLKMSDGCLTVKRNFTEYEHSTNLLFRVKVAINTIGFRSSAKGKVVSFKKKNNKYKRSRQKLAIFVGGNIYDENCGDSFQFIERKPSPNGFKKRKQLKVVNRVWGQVWQCKDDELSATYDINGGYSGTISL